MTAPARYLSASEAARRLGVSAKALRLYESRGLVVPARTAAGWRAYGPDEMRRAGEVAALRALGFSLAQVGRVLEGEMAGLEPALAAHQGRLEAQLGQLSSLALKVRAVREALAAGPPPSLAELARLAAPAPEPVVAFDLPWPWGGERFELREVRPLNYIIGPLGSGKTRLAARLAEELPDAMFLGLDRTQAPPPGPLTPTAQASLAWLAEDGAAVTEALTVLVGAIEAETPAMLVIDLVEQGLDEPTQQALAAHLRRRAPGARPLFLLTRSSAILDLEAVGPHEAILLCPANHSPPSVVAPHPGAPGYEAVASCLASPVVRARTEGMVAVRAGHA